MITLFVEFEQPQRALLIMDQADILECKVTGQQSFNYSTGKFTGEIFVKDIPFEKLKISTKDLLKEVDFKDLKHAKNVMDKLHSSLPELPGNTVTLDEILSERPDGLVKVGPGEYEVADADKAFKDSAASQQSNNNQQKEKKTVIRDLDKLKDAVKDKAQSNEKADSSKKEQKDKKNNNDKPKTNWPGATLVATMKHFEKGFAIGKAFRNAQGETEVMLTGSKVSSDNNQLKPIFIFSKIETAKFAFDALSTHPLFNKHMSACDIFPLSNLKPETLEKEALLIHDPKSFVNHLAKVITKPHTNGKQKFKRK